MARMSSLLSPAERSPSSGVHLLKPTGKTKTFPVVIDSLSNQHRKIKHTLKQTEAATLGELGDCMPWFSWVNGNWTLGFAFRPFGREGQTDQAPP